MQQPASHGSMGDPIYEEFYGLKEQPFAISTDPRFHYFSASHQRAYQELITGLQRGEPLLLLTGEAGTGKTTLSRAVLAGLGDRTFAALVLNPYMSGGEILKLILRDFGLISREHLRQGALARAEPSQLLETLEGFLLTISAVKSRAVVIIDEAQSLAAAALDQVRLLTALERNGQHLIQVIFGGQPKLLDTLKKDNMYALNERITRRVHLGPLLENEIRPYVEHRIAVAGGADRIRFDEEAVQLLADMSRGLPRRVNLLADRALQEGKVERAGVITGPMVKRAARLMAGPQKPPTPAPAVPAAISAPAPVAAPASVAAPPAANPVVSAPAAPAAAPSAATEPQLVTPPAIDLAASGGAVSIFATLAALAEPEPAPAPVPDVPATPTVLASAPPAPAFTAPAPAVPPAVAAPAATAPPATAPPATAPPAPAPPAPVVVPEDDDADVIARPFQELASMTAAADPPATPAADPSFALEIPSRRSGPLRKILAGAGAVIVLGAIGYGGYFSGQMLASADRIPVAPDAPPLFTPRPSRPLPAPTWAEAEGWIEDLKRSLQLAPAGIGGFPIRPPGGGL